MGETINGSNTLPNFILGLVITASGVHNVVLNGKLDANRPVSGFNTSLPLDLPMLHFRLTQISSTDGRVECVCSERKYDIDCLVRKLSCILAEVFKVSVSVDVTVCVCLWCVCVYTCLTTYDTL